jgi:type II secretory pathway component PulC
MMSSCRFGGPRVWPAALLAGAALAVAAVLLARAGRVRALPVATPDAPGAAPVFAQPGELTEVPWQVFRARGAPAAPREGPASRFRLAGTFIAFSAEGGGTRRAILDVLATHSQAIVREGDTLEDVRVARILPEGVVLVHDGLETQLWLSFARPGAAGGGGGGAGAGAPGDGAEEETALAAFGGRRVGPNRWVFRRDALEAYYQELMDDPERLLRVFDSLKPLYNAERSITGYHLGIEGEGPFFEAVGLREGDVVRRVNSLDMTSRRRAEYFIREFAANRANAFVLDIERNGTPEKLIYQVR